MPHARTKAPLAVIVLIAAFLCPTEFSLFIGDLRIPPYRLVLLALVPIALLRLATPKGPRIRSFDAPIAVFGAWTSAIYAYHEGTAGLVYGSALALDGVGAYLVARAFVRTEAHFQAVLAAIATAIAVAALIALPETLLGRIYTHEFLNALTGYNHPTSVETRLGLTRAYGTFDHPIHYGAFCAALFAQFWYASRSPKVRYGRAALLAGATFLSLSSAPILGIGLQIGLITWDRLTRQIANRTVLTLAALAGLYVGASLVMTRSPINFIATGLTLDSWTGFYRLKIWEYGWNNVLENPWTGIGLSDWSRAWWMASPTIDAFWLVIAMREGLPGLILIIAGIALIVQGVAKHGARHSSPSVRRISRGWIMSLIALFLVGCTVHYWNVLYAFLFFFIGLAGWIADPVRRRATARPRGSRALPRVIAIPSAGPSMGPRPALPPLAARGTLSAPA